MSKSYSASVVRGTDTYVFFNGRDSDDNGVLKFMKVRKGGNAAVQIFEIKGENVPASDGPIAATTLFNGGIRLYVINKKTIAEYGVDDQNDPSDPASWKKEGFTKIDLAQGSFLTALGRDEFAKGNEGVADAEKIRLRLYYTAVGADDQVTQNTYTQGAGWVQKTIKV